MKSGDKGLFITTANYSSKTREFAKDDQSRPISLIDGKTLVESCIDNEIGFVYQPIFSKNAMDALGCNNNNGVERNHTTSNIEQPIVVVDKQITANDIRARILRMPKALINILDDNDEYVNVIFAGNEPKRLKIDKSRCYLAGVTQLYKSSGIIRDDRLYEPQKVVWKIYSDKVEIILRGNE